MISGEVLVAGGAMTVLAVAVAYVLGRANKTFHVEVDPRVEAAVAALPGANCGGCGYVGCSEYAEAVVLKGEQVTKCTVGGASVATALAGLMGVEVGESWPYRAVVHCGATTAQRLQRRDYRGEQSCGAANMISGIQGCTYGCLGLGDCVAACKFAAIHVCDGLATVDYERCTGCGACARACPRHIITMVPFKAERMLVVKCSNKDTGKDVTSVCTVGCIGCGICARTNKLLQIDSGLAGIDYDQYDPATADFATVLSKCPRESLVWVGKPTPRDLAAVADEKLPDRVEADFKTTVDDAEWRG